MVDQAKIIELPKFLDARGNLSFVEELNHVPFEIERSYWIHAYKENQEFIVALSGSFDVILDNGENAKIYSLNRSYYGLYIPKGMWRQMQNFSTNSLALVLASTRYSPVDYIHDYEEFKRWIK